MSPVGRSWHARRTSAAARDARRGCAARAATAADSARRPRGRARGRSSSAPGHRTATGAGCDGYGSPRARVQPRGHARVALRVGDRRPRALRRRSMIARNSRATKTPPISANHRAEQPVAQAAPARCAVAASPRRASSHARVGGSAPSSRPSRGSPAQPSTGSSSAAAKSAGRSALVPARATEREVDAEAAVQPARHQQRELSALAVGRPQRPYDAACTSGASS